MVTAAPVGGDGHAHAVAVAAALRAARGEWVTVLGSGESLLPGALAAIGEVLDAAPGTDLVWADARIGSPGGPRLWRPAWSPLRLLGESWLGAPWFVPTARAQAAADLLDAAGGAWRLALLLEATRDVRAPLHVRRPLAVVPDRCSTDEATSEVAVVARHLHRLGDPAATVTAGSGGTRRVRHGVRGTPSVSVVVPTRFSSGHVLGKERTFVLALLDDLATRTDWHDLEVVLVVDDGVADDQVARARAALPGRVRTVAWTGPFSFSGKVNLGVAAADGDLVLLCNDDVAVVEPAWLAVMVGALGQPRVGMVGALLLFEDGTVQHAGHHYRTPRRIGHVALGAGPDDLAADPPLLVEREVSGVTAACALLPRRLYLDVGGSSPQLPVGFNDVDLSLKVRDAGLRVVLAPEAVLHHFETRTRRPGVAPFEQELVVRRWARMMQPDDPYWPAAGRRRREPAWPPLVGDGR